MALTSNPPEFVSASADEVVETTVAPVVVDDEGGCFLVISSQDPKKMASPTWISRYLQLI